MQPSTDSELGGNDAEDIEDIESSDEDVGTEKKFDVFDGNFLVNATKTVESDINIANGIAAEISAKYPSTRWGDESIENEIEGPTLPKKISIRFSPYEPRLPRPPRERDGTLPIPGPPGMVPLPDRTFMKSRESILWEAAAVDFVELCEEWERQAQGHVPVTPAIPTQAGTGLLDQWYPGLNRFIPIAPVDFTTSEFARNPGMINPFLEFRSVNGERERYNDYGGTMNYGRVIVHRELNVAYYGKTGYTYFRRLTGKSTKVWTDDNRNSPDNPLWWWNQFFPRNPAEFYAGTRWMADKPDHVLVPQKALVLLYMYYTSFRIIPECIDITTALAIRWCIDPMNRALLTAAAKNPDLTSPIRKVDYCKSQLPQSIPSYDGTHSMYRIALYLIAYHGPGTNNFIPGLAVDTSLRLYAPSLYGYILWSHIVPRMSDGSPISSAMQEKFNVFFMRVVSSPMVYVQLVEEFNNRMASAGRISSQVTYPPPHAAALRRQVVHDDTDINEEWIMLALHNCGLTVEHLVPASVFTTRQMDYGLRATQGTPLHAMFCLMDNDRLHRLDKDGPLVVPKAWDGWIVPSVRDKEMLIGILEGEEWSIQVAGFDRYTRDTEDWVLLGQDPVFVHCLRETYLLSKATGQAGPTVPTTFTRDNVPEGMDVAVDAMSGMSLSEQM